MRFNIIFIIILLSSCSANITKLENRSPYNSKGFAYIFKESDNKKNFIKGRLDNSKLEISISELRYNSLIKLINPKTQDSLIINNTKKLKYPDFYKIVISEKVAEKLNINSELPLIEIFEIKKNKSFVAEKAKIFNEEKKISSNAPVTQVKISNISKNKIFKKKKEKIDLYILIASFYSEETARFLKQRISKEMPKYDIKKLKIIKKSNKQIDLISGPYNAINLIKNDYIILRDFGFEQLDIGINE